MSCAIASWNSPNAVNFKSSLPSSEGKKEPTKKLLSSLTSQGFVRVRIDGEVRDLSDHIELDKNQIHDIEIVVDRLICKPGLQERLTDSLATALKQADGVVMISAQLPDEKRPQEILFSENFACPEHGAVMEELSPRLFSFNSPYGACPACHGLGSSRSFAPERVIPDPSAPVYSAIAPWSDKDNSYYLSVLFSVGQAFDFEINTPWNQLSAEQQQILLYGSPDPIWIETDSRYSDNRGYYRHFAGVLAMLQRQYDDTSSEQIRDKLEQYLVDQVCEVCGGKTPQTRSPRRSHRSI